MNTFVFAPPYILILAAIFWILVFYCMILFIRFANEQHKEYVKRNQENK